MHTHKRSLLALIRHPEFKALARLSLPLVSTLLLQMGLQVVDAIMMGHISTKALAGGALSVALIDVIIVTVYGILNVASVKFSYALGQRDLPLLNHFFQSNFVLSVILLIPILLLIWFAPAFFLSIGQNPAIVAQTARYLHSFIFGMPFILLIAVLEALLTSLRKPQIITLAMVCAIPINLALIFILAFGQLGTPALGIEGIGFATSITELLLCSVLLWASLRQRRHFPGLKIRFGLRCHTQKLKMLWQLGWPAGLRNTLEAGMFSIASIMIGYFGAQQLAAHQIALQYTNLSIMVSVGIGQALTVFIAQNLGKGQLDTAKLNCKQGLVLGWSWAILAMLLFTTCAHPLIALYAQHNQNDQIMLYTAKHFLLVAGLFQIIDATQVIVSMCLKAYQDTFIPMVLGLVCYWGLGLVCAYTFGFLLHWHGLGVWIGLALGVLTSALALSVRLIFLTRKKSV